MSDLMRDYMTLAGQEMDAARACEHSIFRGGPEFEFELAIEEVPVPLREQTKEAFFKGLDLCESPIESRILPWLLCQKYNNFVHHPRLLLKGEAENLPPFSVAVIPQLQIGKRRVDFALAASRGGPVRFVVVECDGALYHSDEKKDADRNAMLLEYKRVLSVHVVPGVEIYNDAKGAARRASREVTYAWSVRNPTTAPKFCL